MTDSQTKGKAGEREIAGILRDITGHDIQRRVRNHAGDSDLLGVPGWAVEVKRHKKATRAMIRGWWAQTCSQSGDDIPVLFYKQDRDKWRAVWPLAVSLAIQDSAMWGGGYEWTAEGSPEAWAAVLLDVGAQVEPHDVGAKLETTAAPK